MSPYPFSGASTVSPPFVSRTFMSPPARNFFFATHRKSHDTSRKQRTLRLKVMPPRAARTSLGRISSISGNRIVVLENMDNNAAV